MFSQSQVGEDDLVEQSKKIWVSAASIAILFSFVSCGNGLAAAEKDSSARVVLDYKNSQIIYPLDKYFISFEDKSLIEKAVEVIISSCTIEDGYPLNPTIGAVGDESREYGMWNVDRASRNGFSLSGQVEQSDTKQQFDAIESTPEWGASRQRCLQVPEIKERLKAVTPDAWTGTTADGAPPPSSLLDRLRGEAASLAQSDPKWKEIKDKYQQCLRSNGLTPADGWGSQQALDVMQGSGNSSDAKEREIRIAVQEAKCNQEVGVTQQLGDLEASYQAPLIKKNEAALAEEYEKVMTKVEAAKKELQ